MITWPAFTDAPTEWNSCHEISFSFTSPDTIRRVHDRKLVEDFDSEFWTTWFSALFDNWHPESGVCSSDGEVVVLWDRKGTKVYVMKRHPTPVVMGVFSMPMPSPEFNCYNVSCDWVEEEQKGMLVFTNVKNTLYCWPFTQKRPVDQRIEFRLSAWLQDSNRSIQYDLVRPSVRDGVIYVPHCTNGFDFRTHLGLLALRIPIEICFR
jgi:hypothetical protein